MRPESLETLLPLIPELPDIAETSAIHRARSEMLRGDLIAARESLVMARQEFNATDSESGEGFLELEEGRYLLLEHEPAKAITRLMNALEISRRESLVFLEIDATVMIGFAQPPKGRKVWWSRALELAEASTDVAGGEWRACLHLIEGWLAFDARKFSDALARFELSLDLHPRAVPARGAARWARARTLRALSRFDEALHQQLELWEDGSITSSSRAFVDLEVAENLQALGRTEEARPRFQSAHEALALNSYYRDNHGTDLARIQKMAKRAP